VSFDWPCRITDISKAAFRPLATRPAPSTDQLVFWLKIWLPIPVDEEATFLSSLCMLVRGFTAIRTKEFICRRATSTFSPFLENPSPTMLLPKYSSSTRQSSWRLKDVGPSACSVLLLTPTSAAKAGMAVLRSGGSAVDAVEMAIKVLEDREITNAGYGSNLAMNGTVECDATIVDHYGRSGAVGAMSRKVMSLKKRLCMSHARYADVALRGPESYLRRTARTRTVHEALVSPTCAP